MSIFSVSNSSLRLDVCRQSRSLQRLKTYHYQGDDDGYTCFGLGHWYRGLVLRQMKAGHKLTLLSRVILTKINSLHNDKACSFSTGSKPDSIIG